MYDGDGNTTFPGPAGSSTPVNIRIKIVRQVVINYMGEVIYIESASCNISGYKHL